MKKYERKYRKRKNKPEPPVEPVRPVLTEDPNSQLLADRTKAAKALFNDVRNADIRVVVKGAPLDASLVKEAPDEEAILKELTAKKKKKKKKSIRRNRLKSPLSKR